MFDVQYSQHPAIMINSYKPVDDSYKPVDVTNKSKRSDNTSYIKWIVIVILLLIIFSVMLYVFKNKDKTNLVNKPEQQTTPEEVYYYRPTDFVVLPTQSTYNQPSNLTVNFSTTGILSDTLNITPFDSINIDNLLDIEQV